MTLDPSSSTPLYRQIRVSLLGKIRSGIFPVGSRLPSERELAAQLKVSRMTVRQAILDLAKDGYVFSQVGKGTFVAEPKFNQNLRALYSFSAEMKEQGGIPHSRVLCAELRPAPAAVAGKLGISVGDEVVFLKRLRMVDQIPLVIEAAHLAHRSCPDMLKRHDFSRESLYEVLRSEYGWVLVWAEQSIEARLPNTDEMELLQIDRATPVLAMSRITHDQLDQSIEYVESVSRGDQYKLRTVLRTTPR